MNASGCPFPSNNQSAAADKKVVDYFDHNTPEYGRHRYEWYQSIRDNVGPVFWTPHNGGFWVVVGYPELNEVAKHWETFSSKGPQTQARHIANGGAPSDINFQGLFAPPWPTSARMLEEDPPMWRLSRRPLTKMFSGSEAEKWRTRFQELADACIDRCIESGKIDFAKDLSSIVPTVFSLELIGVPTGDHEAISWSYHQSSHATADDPAFAEAMLGIERMTALIASTIDAEAAKPHGSRPPSLIGCLLDARDLQEDKSTAFTNDEILQMAHLVISAGIDTTSALLGTAFVLMTQHPELKQQLIANPEIIEDSFNEFLRIATPTAGLCRTATQDVELGGQQIKRGDRVMICFAAANRDPREFPEPDTVIFERKPNRHVGFGTGIHRCIGANFAQLEFEVILATVLKRIPDFQVDLKHAEIFENVGVVSGWKTVPATFTPGKKIGVNPKIPGWTF